MRRSRRYSNERARTVINQPTLEEVSKLCAQQFSPPRYRVRRDDGSGTVWVSQEGGQLSIGIRPDVIERRGAETVLADTREKLSQNA